MYSKDNKYNVRFFEVCGFIFHILPHSDKSLRASSEQRTTKIILVIVASSNLIKHTRIRSLGT